jgi:hypothetical protein
MEVFSMTQTGTAPPRPQDVTDSDAPGSIGASRDIPSTPKTSTEHLPGAETPLESITDRAGSGLVQRIRAYWQLPAPLAEQPPSWKQMLRYARHGHWTTSTWHPKGATVKDARGHEEPLRTGAVRRLGVAWAYGVAATSAAVCRYTEWILARPGRAIPIYLLWRLAIVAGPGAWLIDNLIRPVLAAASWVLL